MVKEIDYSTYSEGMRDKVMQVVYAELGVSPKTGWVRFLNRSGKLSLHYADELGFWLAHDRHLTPLEAGAEDTGSSFRAWATLIDPSGASASGEASVVKTTKRLDAMRKELENVNLVAIEQLALNGDWPSIELQRGLTVALAGQNEGDGVALTAALSRILDGAQKQGEARDLVLELLPAEKDLGAKLDAASSRVEFRNLASEYVDRLHQALEGPKREKTLRIFVLAVAKTVEDLNTRALALDRAKARAAIDLCKGRIVKGIKRVSEAKVIGESKPAAETKVTEVVKAKPVEVVAKPPVEPAAKPKPVAVETKAKPIEAPVSAKAAPKAIEVKAAAAKPAASLPEAKVAPKPPEAAGMEAAKVIEKPKAATKEVAPGKVAKPASAKQQAYVRDLMRKAGVKPENMVLRMGKLVGAAKKIEELSAAEAATAIDKLLEVLKKKKPS
jgi:hypothetical protein